MTDADPDSTADSGHRSDADDAAVIDPAPDPAIYAGSEPAGAALSAEADPVAGAGPVVDVEPAPVFKLVEIVNVVFSLPSPSPIVHLSETEAPFRVIDFPIGLPEAQSIALALDHEKAVRPSAHELLSAVIAATGSDIVAVRFTAEREGTIIAELDIMSPNGHHVLDCRPTDGIAVALRQVTPVPILCDERLFED